MTVLLALDLGSSTGWAFCHSGGSIFSGSWDFKPKRFEGGGMRYLRFRRMLDEFAGGNEVQAVYFEEVRRHLGTDAAHIYGGLMATLETWCEEKQLPYQGVPIGVWKRELPGLRKGNASKEQVLTAVRALGYSPTSHDEADAIGVLLHARSLHPGHSP